MIIDEIILNDFGRFNYKHILFDEGLNIVYGANESGKTTLQAFIISMLYSLDKKDAIKYLPWGKKQYGAVNILKYTLDSGESYTIEKNFNRKTTSIFKAQPHQDVTALFPIVKKDVLFMEELTGLNRAAFETSVFTRQMGVRIEHKSGKDIAERLLRLSHYGDERIDYHQAMKRLDDIKDGIGLGNVGKYKKLVRVNQLIMKLEEEKKKAYANLENVRELQQKINELNIKREQVCSDIKELSAIKEYKKLPLKIHIIELQERIKHFEEEKEGIEQQLDMYDRFSSLTSGEMELIDEEYNRFKILGQQADTLKAQIEQQVQEKEAIIKHYFSSHEIGANDSVRSVLIEERIEQRGQSLLWRSIWGIAAMGLIGNVAFALSRAHLFGYLLFLFIPVIGFFVWKGYKQKQEEIKSLRGQLSYIKDQSEKNDELKAIDKYLTNINVEYGKIQEAIRSISLKLFEKAATVGIRCSDQDMIDAVLHEIKQAFNSRSEIVRRLSECDRELIFLKENLDAVSQAVAGSVAPINGEPIMPLHYWELTEKYNINEGITAEQLEGIIEEENRQLSEIERGISAYTRELEILTAQYKHPGDIDERLEAALREKQHYEETKEAADIAKYFLQQSLQDIQQQYTPDLNKYISSFLAEITENRYNDTDIETNLDVVIRDLNQGTLRPDALSNGTIDQVYLALRLAVVHLLSNKDTLPLILDETFVQYDDERLANTLYLLARISRNRQIILFTCRQRELEVLEQRKEKYNLIRL